MAAVQPDGDVSPYPLTGDAQLNAIACRYQGEAWVTGNDGLLLYTSDGGTSWSAQTTPATSNLRSVATQDSGPVFIAGDGAFLTTSDTGKTWTSLGDGATHFRSVAAAQSGTTVLAVDDNGGVWSYDATTGALARSTAIAGARAVALSPEGDIAVLAGAGLWQSYDAGRSWSPMATDPSLMFDDVSVDDEGGGMAVGTAGAIASFDLAGHVTVQHVGTASLHTLHLADPNDTSRVGYAAGDNGAVFITQDSGATWTPGTNVGKTVFGVDVIGFGHR
jgi:photosystem II stability/assembly factor-like uncharacterized protein